jgi:predicted transcriptional regulator
MRSVARGEGPASSRAGGRVPTALSREALDLLGAVLRERPASVTALAALTGRAQPNVSRSLQALAANGLIRLVRDGRDVRPEGDGAHVAGRSGNRNL